jgi:hypothetical protein
MDRRRSAVPNGPVPRRAQLAAARGALLGTLRGHSYRLLRAYRTLPLVALELSPSAVLALERERRAATVQLDRRNGPDLAKSVPLVEADETASLGFGGGGETIAVLD